MVVAMADPDAVQNHDQPVMVQSRRAQRFGHTAAGTPQSDLHPFDLGEDAETDLTRLDGQREHHLRRWAMEGLSVLI